MRQGKRAPLTRAAAEALAAQALAFLAQEPARLTRFLSLTGLDAGDVRSRVHAPEFMSAVLDHLTDDESALLVFAASVSVAPETVAAARDLLQGTAQVRSTA
jgi:hypothetical protein